MNLPTIRDVYRAKKTIAPHIPKTPLHFSAGLSELLDARLLGQSERRASFIAEIW